MAKSPVHHISSNDADDTDCGIRLWGTSNRKAPVCSTNPEHTTCPKCAAAEEK